MTQQALIDYIFGHMHLLKNRDFLIDIMTTPEYTEPDQRIDEHDEYIVTMRQPYIGKLVLVDTGLFYSVTGFTKLPVSEYGEYRYQVALHPIPGLEEPEDNTPLINPQDRVVVPAGAIANHPNGDPIDTTFGRLLANYTFLADPFGDIIPYINKKWAPDHIEALITDLIIREKVTADQLNHYARNIYFLGHMTELCVPAVSKKALTVSPAILQRKKELLEKYKDRLAQNDPVAMSLIESELVKMDKADLADDVSSGFLIEGKNYGVHRKNMFLTRGMMESFGDAGSYGFMQNSLAEGWTPRDFEIICNEIRMGSYSRAKETALGGEEAKFLMRVSQNIRITQQDCGSTKGLPYNLSQMILKEFEYRYVMERDGLVLLTPENLSSYLDKDVVLRSPTHCKTKDGYCYVCSGKLYEAISQEAMVSSITATAGSFLSAALKKSHGSAVEVVDISQFWEYTF